MENNKWTICIKTLRLAERYSLRQAGEALGVSAPYLHDVESGARKPTKKFVDAMVKLYNLDEDGRRLIYDAAAEANDDIPYDVKDFLKSNPEAMKQVKSMMKEKKHVLQRSNVNNG